MACVVLAENFAGLGMDGTCQSTFDAAPCMMIVDFALAL